MKRLFEIRTRCWPEALPPRQLSRYDEWQALTHFYIQFVVASLGLTAELALPVLFLAAPIVALVIAQSVDWLVRYQPVKQAVAERWASRLLRCAGCVLAAFKWFGLLLMVTLSVQRGHALNSNFITSFIVSLGFAMTYTVVVWLLTAPAVEARPSSHTIPLKLGWQKPITKLCTEVHQRAKITPELSRDRA